MLLREIALLALALAAAVLGPAPAHAACQVDDAANGLSAGDSLLLDATIDFRLQWAVSGSTITLALSSNHAGYLGIGIGEPTSGHMVGADVLTARFVGAFAQIEDRFVPWRAFPFASNIPGVADRSTAPFAVYAAGVNVSVAPSLFPELDAECGGTESWELLGSAQSGGCQHVVVRRALTTGDAADRDFTPGTVQPLLWAWGASAAMEFHDGQRGVVAVDVGSAATGQGTFAEPPCVSPGCEVVELGMGGYTIPARETTYACRSFDMADFMTGDHHAVAIYPDIDKTKYVHHILVHRCNNGQGAYVNAHVTAQVCGGSGSGSSPLTFQCESMLYGWAVGVGPLVLPAEAGLRVGSSSGGAAGRFLVMEVHYDNPAEDVGQVDNTAMRMHVVSTLRTHDAGVLGTGDPFTRMQSLPAGQSFVHRQGVCERHCIQEALGVGETLKFFAVFNHEHSFGRRMWTNQYDSAGAFKRTIAPIDFWNFGTQRGYDIDVTLERGDELFVHCQYDTSKWPAAVTFGQDSLQEMCMAFFSYYPVVQVDGAPFASCGGAANLNQAVAGVNAANPAYSPTLIESVLNNPKAERMYGSLCSASSNPAAGHSEMTTVGNFTYPVQPVDPRVYSAGTNSWDTDVTAGVDECVGGGPTGAPTPLGSSSSDDADFDIQVRAVGEMDLYWRVQDDCTVSLRLSVPGDRWVAVGFGTRMTDGRVLLAEAGDAVGEFTLSQRSELGLNAWGGASGVVGTPEWTFEGGVRTLRVNMTTIAGASFKTGCTGARRRQLGADTQQSLILAYGAALARDQHVAEAVVSVDWASGLAGVLAPADVVLDAHAYIMSAVFGVCLPVLILFPATKRPASQWFKLHRALAGLSLLGALGGLVAGVLHVRDVGGAHVSKPHHWLGLLALALVLANPLLGALRPDKGRGTRAAWLMAHRAVGYGAAVAGLANLYVGATLAKESESYGGESSVTVAAAFIAVGVLLLCSAVVSAVLRQRVDGSTVASAKQLDL